jgi:hypothetical protein
MQNGLVRAPTFSIHLGSSLDASSRSAARELHYVLWIPKVHYIVSKSLFTSTPWPSLLHSESPGSWTSSIARDSKYKKTQRFGNCICFRPQVKGWKPTLLGLLERANLSHWTKGPNWVDVSPPQSDDGNRSSFRNAVFPNIQNYALWRARNPLILSVTHRSQDCFTFYQFISPKPFCLLFILILSCCLCRYLHSRISPPESVTETL